MAPRSAKKGLRLSEVFQQSNLQLVDFTIMNDKAGAAETRLEHVASSLMVQIVKLIPSSCLLLMVFSGSGTL